MLGRFGGIFRDLSRDRRLRLHRPNSDFHVFFEPRSTTTPPITPLDTDGSVLPDVSVESAFGSDSGQLVVTKNSNFDILYFSGPASDEVSEVRTEVIAAASVSAIDQQAVPVETLRYASDRDEVEKFDVFDSVVLKNPNATTVKVRVVCLSYDDPSPGSSQQAIERIELIDRVGLRGGETLSVETSSAFANLARSRGYGCASVKSHFVA